MKQAYLKMRIEIARLKKKKELQKKSRKSIRNRMKYMDHQK